MVTSISLRNARPSDKPPLPPGMFGYSPNGGMAMPKLEFLIGIFRSCVNDPPGVMPERKRDGEKWLMKPNGWNCCDTICGWYFVLSVRMFTLKSTPMRSKKDSAI